MSYGDCVSVDCDEFGRPFYGFIQWSGMKTPMIGTITYHNINRGFYTERSFNLRTFDGLSGAGGSDGSVYRLTPSQCAFLLVYQALFEARS